MQNTLIVINPKDNVGVVTREVKRGENLDRTDSEKIQTLDNIPKNHKIALVSIPIDAPVIKYGEVIGFAKAAIAAGSWVHTHNLKPQGE
jgi:hypothetical protein